MSETKHNSFKVYGCYKWNFVFSNICLPVFVSLEMRLKAQICAQILYEGEKRSVSKASGCALLNA